MDARVPIVEDDLDTAEQIGAVPHDDGLSFERVGDGREALQRAAGGVNRAAPDQQPSRSSSIASP